MKVSVHTFVSSLAHTFGHSFSKHLLLSTGSALELLDSKEPKISFWEGNNMRFFSVGRSFGKCLCAWIKLKGHAPQCSVLVSGW